MARTRQLLFRGLLVTTIAGLVALAGLISWVRSDGLERQLIQVVEFVVERQTGEGLTIGRLAPQWPPGLRVEGAHFFDVDTGETIAAVEQADLPLRFTWSGVQLGDIVARGLVLSVALDGKGRPVAFEDAPRGNGQPLRRLPWRTLTLHGASLALRFPDGAVELDDVDLLPDDEGLHDLSGGLRVAFRQLDERTWLSARGLRLGPDVIDVPELRAVLPQLSILARARWPLGGDIDADLGVSARLDALTPLLATPRALHGVADIDVHVEGTPSSPVARVNAWGRGLGYDAPGILTPLLTYEFGEAIATVEVDREEARLLSLKLHPSVGEVSATGRLTLADRMVRDLVVSGTGLSLRRLLQMSDAAPTPWIDLEADLEVVAEGPVQPLRLSGQYELAVRDLFVGDRALGLADVRPMLDIPRAWSRGTLVLDKDHVVLDGLARSPRNAGTAVVDIGFKPRGPLDLRFRLDQADLRDFQPLRGVGMTGHGSVSGSIQGPFNQLRFDGEGDLRDFSVLGIPYADHLLARLSSPNMKSIELHEARAVRGLTPYTGFFRMDFRTPVSMDTDIVFAPGRVEDLVRAFVDVDGLAGGLTGGHLSLHGPLYDLDGDAEIALRDATVWGERFDVGRGRGFMDQGLFTLDDLRLSRRDGREGLVLRGAVDRKWALDMELLVDALSLPGLDAVNDDVPIFGRLGAVVRLGNTLFDPTPRGVVRIDEVRYAGVDVAPSVVRFETAPGGQLHFAGDLVGRTATAEGQLMIWGEQPYHVDVEMRDLPAHLLYPVAADGQRITALASGHMTLDGDFGDQWSPVDLEARFDEVSVAWDRHRLTNPAPWSYRQEGKGFRLDHFVLEGEGTRVRLAAVGEDGLLLTGDGRFDLDLLRAVVPGLTRAQGEGTLSVYALGSAPTLRAVVAMEVDADLLEHDAVPSPFEDVRGRLEFAQHQLVVDAGGDLGGGAFSVSGRAEAEAWWPTRFDLALQASDAQLRWVDTLPPARGDATLRVDGPADRLLLSGDVTVRQMDFVDRIDWEDWVVDYRAEMLVDPAVATSGPGLLGFDVHIGADGTIRLRNNVADAVASADLRLVGDSNRPGLTGTVTLHEGGLALLQDREFRISRGNLAWEDPYTWDPRLDFDLETDVTSRDQPVRVDYLVTGPFSDWRTATRSDPPLPQADLNALLWFGVTTDDLEEMGALPTAVGQAAADLLLTDFLVSGRAGELEELPVLFNRLDLATGVNARGEYSPDPRLVVEKRLNDLGGVDLSWELNLVRPEDNFFQVERRIGGVWSLAGWYATLQRDRVLPIGGAYGVDVTARWEAE